MNTELTAGRAKALARMNLSGLKYTECLDEVAKVFGIKDQTTMMSMLKASAPLKKQTLIKAAFSDPYHGVPLDERSPDMWGYFHPRDLHDNAAYIEALMKWSLFKLRTTQGPCEYRSFYLSSSTDKTYDQWWKENIRDVYSRDAYVAGDLMNTMVALNGPKLPFPWILTAKRLSELKWDPAVLVSQSFSDALRTADEVIARVLEYGNNTRADGARIGSGPALDDLQSSITQAFIEMKAEMAIVFDR